MLKETKIHLTLQNFKMKNNFKVNVESSADVLTAASFVSTQIDVLLPPENSTTNLTSSVGVVNQVFNVLNDISNMANISTTSFASVSGVYNQLLQQPANLTQQANIAPR